MPTDTTTRGTDMPFQVGPAELIVVLVVALIVLGPKKLPEVGRSLGKGIRGFKDSISDHVEEDIDPPAVEAARHATPTASATERAHEHAVTSDPVPAEQRVPKASGD